MVAVGGWEVALGRNVILGEGLGEDGVTVSMTGWVIAGPQAESKMMKITSMKRCLGSIWSIVPEVGVWFVIGYLCKEGVLILKFIKKLHPYWINGMISPQ